MQRGGAHSMEDQIACQLQSAGPTCEVAVVITRSTSPKQANFSHTLTSCCQTRKEGPTCEVAVVITRSTMARRSSSPSCKQVGGGANSSSKLC